MNLSKIWNDLNDESKGGHPVAGFLTFGIALAIPAIFYVSGIFASMNLEGHRNIRNEYNLSEKRINQLEDKIRNRYVPLILSSPNQHNRVYQDSLTSTLKEIDSLNDIKHLDRVKLKEIEDNKKNFLSWGYYLYKKLEK